MNLEDIKRVVEKGNFDVLLNEYENIFFDCKKALYPLENEIQKRELAKDVSSFANSTIGEGYIFLGVATERSLTHLFDQVSAFAPFLQSKLNMQQYFDVIRDWIFPEIKGIQIITKPLSEDNPDEVIGIIYIPPQPNELKPFLIKKDTVSGKTTETMFGYVERIRDASAPQRLAIMHNYLRNGRLFLQNIEERFNRLERKIEQTEKRQEVEKFDEKIIERRMQLALKDAGMVSVPNFSLLAYPGSAGELQTIFDDSNNSIKKNLEKPPELRYAGWGLATLEQAKIKEGEFIRAENGDRKLIDLYNDGTLIFSALATVDFLAWGRDEKANRLNPLAVVEVVYNFVKFYQIVLKDFKKPVEEINLRFGFNNLWQDDGKYCLPARDLTRWDYDEFELAPKSNYYSKPVVVKWDEFNPSVVAYKVVEQIYLWFGISKDKIPYVKVIEGQRTVDFERISTIR